MMIILRILLFLLPLIAVVIWLRARAKMANNPDALADDVRKMKIGVLLLMAGAMTAAVLLYVFDEDKAPSGSQYSPARMENGKLVPGSFNDAGQQSELPEEAVQEATIETDPDATDP